MVLITYNVNIIKWSNVQFTKVDPLSIPLTSKLKQEVFKKKAQVTAHFTSNSKLLH